MILLLWACGRDDPADPDAYGCMGAPNSAGSPFAEFVVDNAPSDPCVPWNSDGWMSEFHVERCIGCDGTPYDRVSVESWGVDYGSSEATVFGSDGELLYHLDCWSPWPASSTCEGDVPPLDCDGPETSDYRPTDFGLPDRSCGDTG